MLATWILQGLNISSSMNFPPLTCLTKSSAKPWWQSTEIHNENDGGQHRLGYTWENDVGNLKLGDLCQFNWMVVKGKANLSLSPSGAPLIIWIRRWRWWQGSWDPHRCQGDRIPSVGTNLYNYYACIVKKEKLSQEGNIPTCDQCNTTQGLLIIS